jgi:hypothetical protein
MIDDNPWIHGINTEETVENVLGKPARRLTVTRRREHTRPSKLNAMSYKMHKNEVLPPQASELPGGSIERTHRIMQQEFEHIDFANLKAPRDLSKFDCWDRDETGEYWAQFYAGKPGPHGDSPVYVNGEYVWSPVTLLGYSGEKCKFLIQLENGIQRMINRVSIKFKDEDPVLFDQRLTLCR